MATTKPRQTRSRNTSRAAQRKSQEPTDYVAIALAYAEEAVEDRARTKFNKWVRLAAKRFLKDLKRAQQKRPPFFWSPEQANAACDFLENLPHVEGVWETPTITLEPSQIFLVCNLFGFRRADGSRRFTTLLYAVARKNAKSALAAGILLYVFCTEPEVGPQIVSAATTGDQARIVFNVAKRMVEKTSALREAFTLEAFANAIARYEVGGSFKPINAKASTQDGLNPSALCLDEVHAHKSYDLYNVLRSAMGARKNPLYVYTTTEGFETPGPWPEIRKFAFNVLQEVVEADHYLCLYYSLDDEDDDFDESKWVKANPLLGVSISLDKMREYAIEAKQQPGSFSEFRIKRLNRQAAAANSHVDLIKWKAAGRPLPDDAKLKTLKCWGGLDLSSTADMTSAFLVWRETVEGKVIYYVRGRYWVPAEAVEQRNARGTVRYEPWVHAGFITQTQGNVVDYNVVKADVKEMVDTFKPAKFAYDPWNSSQLINDLSEDYPELFEQFRQGPPSYHPALKEFDRAYLSGCLIHGGNPVLQWNAANLVVRRDTNTNMAPDKKRSADKIDGIVSVVMALGVSLTAEPDKEPQLFFV